MLLIPSRFILLIVDFNLVPNDWLSCWEFEVFGSILAAFPDFTLAKRSLVPRFTQQQITVAEESYFNSVLTACRCRDAAIAFGVCGWYESHFI